MDNYEGYGWIKVPKYRMDPENSWEVRYKQLNEHHIAETTFLIAKVRELAERLRGTMTPSKQYARMTPEEKCHATFIETLLESLTDVHTTCVSCASPAEFGHPSYFCRHHWAIWWATGLADSAEEFDNMIMEVIDFLDR